MSRDLEISGGQGKKSVKAKRRSLTLRIDEEDYQQLEALAQFQGATVSGTARSFLLAGLNNYSNIDYRRQGIKEGKKLGKERHGVPFHCGNCGKKAHVQHPDDIQALKEAVEEQHWHCPECDDRIETPKDAAANVPASIEGSSNGHTSMSEEEIGSVDDILEWLLTQPEDNFHAVVPSLQDQDHESDEKIRWLASILCPERLQKLLSSCVCPKECDKKDLPE